ncbi:PiggyBac transposable element-derived protein 4-like [Elysia marginata]|uniref:PiggyBac transposable element-derived protein 4-like n=1 Tax=Elysia marginata TaxID=1093978 RepID=A0AAV4HGV4_9GAST|nr:PiggyBac transposable element-derived protein 4-like [Elysia marginata]
MDMMEDQELVIHPTAHVFLDLRESNTLTQLTNVPLEQGVVAEFFGNNDSDLEDVEEPLPERNQAAAPIYRDRLSPLESQSDDEEERGEVDVEDNGAWRQGATAPEQLPLTGEHGVKKTPDGKSPFSFFRCMVDDDLMGSIVKETNDYAKESLKKKALSPNSRLRKWVDVTVGEMWTFFGLIIAMSLVVIDDLEEYWSTHTMYDLPFFRSIMKRDRFLLILSFLHLAENEKQPSQESPEFDPIYKIRSFVDKLEVNFQESYIPGARIAIDEAMVTWRGPLAFRVYNPDKPDKFGIKIFQLCDSDTSYCSTLEFYKGKKPCSTHGATFDVVNRLIAPYLEEGRTLFVDNYYTIPDLFTYLKQHKTLACGTLRLNRKNAPPPPKPCYQS